MQQQAVITGDITAFTQLSPKRRQALIQETEQHLKSWLRPSEEVATFRGDSYQVLFDTPQRAIRKSIQLIAWFRKRKESKQGLSTRISLGIGSISYRGENVLNSDGPAFHFSGRNFDLMEADTYLSIITADSKKNTDFEIILNFINRYINKWTRAQAEVIYLHLEGQNQKTIAQNLSITQPSVNSRLKSAGWREIEPALEYMIDRIT